VDILITGGAGFLGARLIEALVEGRGRPGLPGFDRIVSLDLAPCPVRSDRVVSEVGSINDPDLVARLVGPGTVAVFHLAAVVSGQAEREFETGMAVNLDGTRALLDACRTRAKQPFFFFSSSLAVFGRDCPDVVGDSQILRPQSSYGAQKAIGEMLVADYSRKGYIRGVAGRLPTVVIRPGKPNAAASSFASSILREPMAGLPATCPVDVDLPLWISSPDAVIRNVLALATLDPARLEDNQAVNLPGITVTPREMLAELGRRFGKATVDLVSLQRDPAIEAIVASWPSAFDTSRALGFGLSGDAGIADIVAQHAATLANG
jgi:nucleoside-diphosphate-sugar epimerase